MATPAEEAGSGHRRRAPRANRPGLCYAMGFVHDRLVTGRRFMCLTMIDPCSKEVSGIEVNVSVNGPRVCRILDRLFLTRPLPVMLIVDKVLSSGDRAQCVGGAAWGAPALPPAPVQNAFIESFNGKFRDKCLNEHWFVTLQEANS